MFTLGLILYLYVGNIKSVMLYFVTSFGGENRLSKDTKAPVVTKKNGHYTIECFE